MSRSTRVSAGARLGAAPAIALRVAVAVAMGFAALSAHAHGFGQRYDLPLPLWLYLLATAAAIVLSFVVAALFLRRAPRGVAYPRVDLLAHRLGRWIAHSSLTLALRLLSLLLFAVAVAAGFWGNQNPYQNIAPTLFWVIGWVGLAYVSAFIGNLWPLINPWRTVFDAAASLCRLGRGRDLAPRRLYPEKAGVWPAFVLLLAFSWIELVYPSPALPAHIAWIAVAYSLLTWTGMVVYGAETWLRHGELFTVIYGVLARFAPTEGNGRLALRPFAAGLLDEQPASKSMTAFVLLILSTVLYDGVLSTPEWNDLEMRVAGLVSAHGDLASIAIRTVGLAMAWALFFGAYVGVSAIMSVAVTPRRSTWGLARSFAFTLVPIAIAYHLAHYFVYLLVQGQYVVPLLSDPFGVGWNLFGTAGYRVDIGIAGARFAWYTAVIAIVVGHVIAVFLAHVRAMGVFPARAAALRSQVPLTALMVAYTFVSLSILAEPITERRPTVAPGEANGRGNSVPEAAWLPEPGTGRLLPVGSGRVAAQKLTYRLLGSAFHDGTRMSAADLLYAYVFAYRWSVRNDAEPAHYDPAIDAATAPMRERLVGVRFVGSDTTSKSFRIADVNVVRELFIVDVYTNARPEDAEQDAAIAPPWSTVPWHLLVLMEEAVSRGWAAFSEAEARRRGVSWLDLVRSRESSGRLAELVATFEREGYRPESLRSLVSADEARQRWAALAAFYRARGHFLVTNGPYQLKQWSADGVALDVFRDLSYPLGVGSYDAYAIPRRAFFTKVEQENDQLRLYGETETIMKFQRSYEMRREPLQSLSADDLKRAAPECRYTVVDSAGRVTFAGVARLGDDATFRVDLKGKLAAGRYTVLAELIVNGNAMNAEIRRIPIEVGAKP